MIDQTLMQQLRKQAEENGEPLVIITKGTSAFVGSAKSISYAFGDSYLALLHQGCDLAAKGLVHACGGIIYAAALDGDISDKQIELLSEALAVARAYKQGRKD